MTGLKNSLESLNIRLNQAEERVSVREGGAQRKIKSGHRPWSHGTPSKEQYMHYKNARLRKRKEKAQKVFLKQ